MQRVRVSSEQSPVHKLGDTQMALTPRFRLATTGPPAAAVEAELCLRHGPLIPGIPDDVALFCLLRVPVGSHPACRAVCRRWRSLLSNKEAFFTRRKELGLRHPFLFVFASHRRTGKSRWQVLDLANLCWHSIPPMPSSRDGLPPRCFASVALPGQSSLLVLGGTAASSSSDHCPLDLALRFEMHRNRWTVVDRMLTPRSSFAAGVIDGAVYVAGGCGVDLSELDSAEVMEGGKWRRLKSMGAGVVVFGSAVVGGKLYLTEGWSWPFLFSPWGRVYDPRADQWEEMRPGLREGWTGSCAVVVHGRLFVICEHESMRAKVYDEESDSWETVPGGEPRVDRSFCLASWDDRIYIVCQDLRITIGHVRRTSTGTGSNANTTTDRSSSSKLSFSIHWEDAGVVGSAFEDFVPFNCQILFG